MPPEDVRSPFPGMDPYIERPALFPDLHDSMITYLRESVQSRLPEAYFAAIGDRVWVEVSERAIGPDVDVLRRRTDGPERAHAGGSSVASTVRSEPVVVTVPHDERREPALEIYARMEGERLVTTIEVLSPNNKTPGAQGRELYLRKQKEVLGSQVNLVEIDLLRGGEHTSAVPYERAIAKTGPFDYHVCVHHFDNLEDYFVYPILLREKLPEVAIPLLPGDPAVNVDLQALFERCYAAGPYRRRIRYAETEPVPPLGPEDADWARGLVAG